MTTTPKTTLTPADANEILQRTLWFARRDGFVVPGSDSDPPGRWRISDTELRFEAAKMELLQGAVALAEYAGDPALLPLVIEALEVWVETTLHHDEDRFGRDVFASAIEVLLSRGAAVTAEVRGLAVHARPSVRLALVQGLKDAAAEFEPLLRGMADDADPQVRTAVKDALAALGEPPWWSGVFSRDPAQVVDPVGAARLGPKLARWADLLNQRFLSAGDKEELYGILDELPDVLARDAVVRLASARDAFHDAAVLARRLARVPDGIEAAIVLASSDREYRVDKILEAWVDCEGVRGEAVARRALAVVWARPASEWEDPSSVAWRVGKLAERLWPDGADPSDLVEQLLHGRTPEDDDGRYGMDVRLCVVEGLAAKSPSCVRTWTARAVRSFLTGEEKALWRRLWHLREAVLAALPLDERREVTRAALGSADDAAASWGIGQLVGAAHDPERDPSVAELMASLCADPRFRGLIAARPELVKAHRELLLEQLRAGRLSLDAASSVFSHLAEPGEIMRDAFLGDAWEGEARSTPARPAVAAGITPEDRAVWRRLRDSGELSLEAVHSTLFALPTGPLCPEDRAFVERALAMVEGGEDRLILGCGVALMAGGTADDLPVLVRLVRKDDDGLIAELVDRMKRRLGLMATRTRGAPAPSTPATDEPKEWMDEDD